LTVSQKSQIVILSPALVILSEAKDLRLLCGVDSAKGLVLNKVKDQLRVISAKDLKNWLTDFLA
jgi:hypothetical protein